MLSWNEVVIDPFALAIELAEGKAPHLGIYNVGDES